MYDLFTDRARLVLQLANQEAQRVNHEYIGTEHILLGLVMEETGVAANVLKNFDIDLRRTRLEVQKILQILPHKVIEKLPQTPKVKKVIDHAIEEARNLNHNYIGTEHLLLGLLREEESVAAQILINLGLNLEVVREEVLKSLGHKVPLEEKSDTPEALRPLIVRREGEVGGEGEPVQMDGLLTDRARLVLELANQEAQRFNHEYIGTEHILLGLRKERCGVAANVLKWFDLDLPRLRLEVEQIVQCGPNVSSFGKLPPTPKAKKVVEYAIEEAHVLNNASVGTEHLLLGLLRDQETVAAQILINLGLKLEDVREEVLKTLRA